MQREDAESRPPDISFEEALSRLEAVVEELEKGELTLAGALEAFREGIGNLGICVQRLTAFEEQIEVLLADYHASAPSWLGSPEPGGKTK